MWRKPNEANCKNDRGLHGRTGHFRLVFGVAVSLISHGVMPRAVKNRVKKRFRRSFLRVKIRCFNRATRFTPGKRFWPFDEVRANAAAVCRLRFANGNCQKSVLFWTYVHIYFLFFLYIATITICIVIIVCNGPQLHTGMQVGRGTRCVLRRVQCGDLKAHSRLSPFARNFLTF